MKKVNPEEIGYFGKSISTLPRDELLEVLSYIAGIIFECSEKDKKIEEFLYVKKNIKKKK
jgi:hypothetical protein